MAPAIECEGCNFKVKTRDEPAPKDQMDGLADARKIHLQELLRVEEDFSRFGRLASYRRTPHAAKFKFYSKTPTEGFEEARIVSRSTYC